MKNGWPGVCSSLSHSSGECTLLVAAHSLRLKITNIRCRAFLSESYQQPIHSENPAADTSAINWRFKKMQASSLLFPYSSQCNDGLHSPLHILAADPFQRRVEGMATGKNIGSRQAHEAEAGAVSAAPD